MSGTRPGLELLDRHQQILDLRSRVPGGAAVAQQAGNLAHTLPGTLIGNAVHDNDRDGIRLAHPLAGIEARIRQGIPFAWRLAWQGHFISATRRRKAACRA